MIFLKCSLRAYYSDEFYNTEVLTNWQTGGGYNSTGVVFLFNTLDV